MLHQTSQSQPLHGVHSQSTDNSLHRIAGLSSLALRVLAEQDRKIEKFDSFFISISLASAYSYDHQLSVETPSSKGNMYPCCFGPMLLALHARLKGTTIRVVKPRVHVGSLAVGRSLFPLGSLGILLSPVPTLVLIRQREPTFTHTPSPLVARTRVAPVTVRSVQ